MPGADLITVDGVEEIRELLRKAPKDVVAQAWLKSLQAAANVIRSELEIRTPYTGDSMSGQTSLTGIGNAAHGGRGALRENLVTDVQLDSQMRGGIAEVGYGKLGHIALWVEYGHRMVTHAGKQVGMVPPHPFMRPAFEAVGEQAIEKFAKTLEATLNRGIAGNPIFSVRSK